MGAKVILKRGKAGPVVRGYPWVFEGWIEKVQGDPQPADPVDLLDWRQSFIARASWNGASKIRCRIFGRTPEAVFDRELLADRLRKAILLRKEILRLPERTDAYRLVHSDGDGLSGLVVDRYGDFLSIQISSLLIDRMRKDLLALLIELVGAHGIIERQDDKSREKEGLEPSEGLAVGSAPPLPLEIQENGLRFLVDLPHGQKTGFFLDQRDNRLAAAGYARGRRVLDAFCYTGGFGVAASVKGSAEEVYGFDSSSGAVGLAARNAALNGAARCTYEKGDAFRVLRQLAAAKQQFGVVILDPPKFSPTKGDRDKAIRAYHEINLQALEVLAPEGVLVTCACSAAMQEYALEEVVSTAARDAGRDLQGLDRRGQGPDHPVPPYFPEGRYLTCLIFRVY